MEQEIIEGNKLIAEFMGEVMNLPSISFLSGEVKEKERRFAYHSSWDWLMPVVEKIEGLGYKFQICRRRVQVTEDAGSQLHVATIKEESKMQSVWLAVIEFIKWYSANK